MCSCWLLAVAAFALFVWAVTISDWPHAIVFALSTTSLVLSADTFRMTRRTDAILREVQR